MIKVTMNSKERVSGKAKVEETREADGFNVTPSGDLVILILYPTPAGQPPTQGKIIKAYAKGKWARVEYEENKVVTPGPSGLAYKQ